MCESLQDPVEIMGFGFKLSDRSRGIGCDEFFLACLIGDGHLQMPIGSWWNILLELIEGGDIFLSQIKQPSPRFFTDRGDNTRQAAAPLR